MPVLTWVHVIRRFRLVVLVHSALTPWGPYPGRLTHLYILPTERRGQIQACPGKHFPGGPGGRYRIFEMWRGLVVCQILSIIMNGCELLRYFLQFLYLGFYQKLRVPVLPGPLPLLGLFWMAISPGLCG